MTSLWKDSSEKTREEKLDFKKRDYRRNVHVEWHMPAEKKVKKYLKTKFKELPEFQVERRKVWNKTHDWPPGIYEPPRIPWRRWERIQDKRIGLIFLVNIHMTRALRFTYRNVIQNGYEVIVSTEIDENELFIGIPSKYGRYVDLD